MEFCKALDFGNAPAVSVDGVVRIERVTANKVRVTYCLRQRSVDGKAENVTVLHTDWDIDVFLKSRELYRAAEEELSKGATANDNVVAGIPLH